MPNIPMVNAKRNVTAGPSAEFMRGENLVPGQNLDKIVSATHDVLSAYSAAHDVTQTNNAKNKFSMLMGDIQVRAAADPHVKLDEKGLPTFEGNGALYLQQIEDAKRLSVKGIDNQMVANGLAAQFNLDGFVASAKIANDIRQKELKFGDGETKKQFDILTAEILQADQNGEVGLREQKMYQRNILTREATMKGVWDIDRASKEEKDATKTIMRNNIYSDNSVSEPESLLLASLKDKNKFTYLSPDDRLSFIKELQIRILRNNQSALRASIQAQLEGRINTLKGLADGTIDYNNPALVTAISEKDPTMGDILINLKNMKGEYFPIGASQNERTKAMFFAESSRQLFKTMNTEQINNWLSKSAKDLKTTQNDVIRLNILAQLAAERGAALNPNFQNQEVVNDHFQMRDALDYFQFAIPFWSPVATERFLIRKYGVNLKGESIKKEVPRIIKQITNEVYPETQQLPGVPNKIMNSNGTIDSIYNGPNELDGEEYGPTTSSDDNEPASGDLE